MKKSEQLASKKNYYLQAKRKVNEVLSRINESISELNDIVSVTKEAGNIDGSSLDNNGIYNLKTEEESIKNKIENYILPSIDNKINNLNDQISYAIEEESII